MSRRHQGAIPKQKNVAESPNQNRRSHNRDPPAPERRDVDESAAVVVPSPAKKWLTTDELFVKKTNVPRPEVLMDHLKRRGLLHESAALRIIREVTEVLREEPNVIRLAEPVAICGDVHGHFYNLPKMFEKGGNPSDKNYLFLGNYVNRGNFGIEVLLYLWSLKLNHPETFFMLRGNHECRHLTERLSFQKECKLKYSDEVYEACIKAFQCLPLAAVVNEQLFCVHGGLSPKISTLKDINKIYRFKEPPSKGPMLDLLWADPTEDYPAKGCVEETKKDQCFFANLARGRSYYYDFEAVREFLKDNRLISVVRSHEVQKEGFKEYRPAINKIASLFTVFSTPNYLDYYTNKGCIANYHREVMTMEPFHRVPDPYELPAQPAAFSTSIPHYIDILTDAQLDLMNFALNEHNNSTLGDEKSQETIRHTLNTTWIKFQAMREQMKSALTLHYQNQSVVRATFVKLYTFDKALAECNPTFEQAKDMNYEKERLQFEKAEEPSDKEKINAKNAETKALESGTASPNSRAK